MTKLPVVSHADASSALPLRQVVSAICASCACATVTFEGPHPIPPAPLVPPVPHAPPSPNASHVPPAPPIAATLPDVPLTAPPEEPPCPPLLLYRLIAALVRSFFQAHVGYYSDIVQKSI